MKNGKLTKHSSDLGIDELVEIAEGISYETRKSTLYKTCRCELL